MKYRLLEGEQQVAHVWSLERGQAQAGIGRERLCSRRRWQLGGEVPVCVVSGGCGRALCVCVVEAVVRSVVVEAGVVRPARQAAVELARVCSNFLSQKSPRPAPAAAWRLHRAGL